MNYRLLRSSLILSGSPAGTEQLPPLHRYAGVIPSRGTFSSISLLTPPDQETIRDLRIWIEATGKVGTRSTREVMSSLEASGLLDDIYMDDTRTRISQGVLMRYRRNFLGRWESLYWVRKGARGKYSLTDPDKIMIDIFEGTWQNSLSFHCYDIQVKKKSSSRIRSAVDRVALRTATRMVRIVRSLEKTFPKKYVKPIAGILTGLLVVPILLLIVTLLLVPVLIWDLFDPFGIGVHLVVYLFYLFLYASAGYLSYILISDVVDIVEIIYHPVNYLLKKTASTIMRPLTKTLRKATVFLAITLGVIELIFALVMVAFGFSCALMLVMVALVLVFLAMVLIAKGITMIVKWFLNLVFRSIFGSIDRRFKISEKANRYGKRIDREIELQNELKRRG